MLNVKDYDPKANRVVLSEKQLSDSQNMHMLVGAAGGCVATVFVLWMFFRYFVEH